MSITPQLDRYLSVRRSLGYDLRTEERRLRRFARFADQEGCVYRKPKPGRNGDEVRPGWHVN
jgi:hypothetical protein